ncbi:MAG: hypothetical protein AB8B63_05890 [Granulosicoccus sp.]
MKVDLLYLLPALAVLICLTGAVFPRKRGTYGKGGHAVRQYSRDTVMTARFTAGALLLATLVTMLWPVQGVDRFVQGLFTTLLFLIPLIAYHLIVWFQRVFPSKGKPAKSPRTRKRSRSYKRAPDILEDSGQANRNQSAIAGGADAQSVNSLTDTASARHIAGVAATGQATRSEGKRSDSSSRSGARDRVNRSAETRNETTLNTRSNRMRNGDKGANSAQKQGHAESDVKEQMDRVSTLVKSYDLGDGKQGDTNRDSIVTDQQPLINSAIDDQTTDLASHNEQALQVSRSEALRKVVATLQDDKRKLQRLVIAQQAAFDSERQSHERTRHVARDAIKVMRDARSGQRMAEKIARRERAERRRLEKEYTKVTKALKNAMSTLANAEGQEANAGKGSPSAA